MLDIMIKNGDRVYQPVVKDGATLKRVKNGPSTFTFTLINDPLVTIEEGDLVSVTSDDLRPYNEHHFIFKGYVFKIGTSKNNEVNITAYDQIRYLNNTDTVTYSDMTLTDMLRMLCDATKIKSGDDIMPTVYVIPYRVEDNKSYLDMIMTAIQLTAQNTGKEYILWDNFGEIALHDTEFFKIGLKINKETAQDIQFETSIDSETYNQVKLFRENEDKTREVFVQSDSNKISKWGLLQTCDSVSKDENGDEKAKTMLNEHNHPSRTCTVSGAFGDMRVRGGTTLHVQFDLVDMGYCENENAVDHFLSVESVTHNFTANKHTMDLDLKGWFAG